MQDIQLLPIGQVRTPFATGAECPRSGEESFSEGVVEIFPAFAPGLHSIAVGQWVTLLSWLHQADRGVLSTHPRGDKTRPRRGVFNTHSPARPNPIGLHDVQVLEQLPDAADGTVRLRVSNVDMMDGTPLVDIKTSFKQRRLETQGAENSLGQSPDRILHDRADARPHESPETLLPQMEAIIAACRDAWQRGLFSGFNGNVSMRCGSSCLITRSGCAKSSLGRQDFALLDIATGAQLAGPPASSEAGMHCAVYRRMPKVDCVAHTHPPFLLALGLRGRPLIQTGGLYPPPPPESMPGQARLYPLFPQRVEEIFERSQLVAQLGWVKEHLPGSQELADAVAEEARKFPAIWMHRHGLTTCAMTPATALALAEELEHLARIELLAPPDNGPAV